MRVGLWYLDFPFSVHLFLEEGKSTRSKVSAIGYRQMHLYFVGEIAGRDEVGWFQTWDISHVASRYGTDYVMAPIFCEPPTVSHSSGGISTDVKRNYVNNRIYFVSRIAIG